MNGDMYSSRDARHGSSRDYPPASRRDRGDRPDRDERRDRGGRRRSRSPPEYRGGRSRRDDAEPDPYTSSRRHQDREREDRYSGRDRRAPADREWDRDRGGSRRDARRDDDDRYDRDRDRDRERPRGFDERRIGGRRDRDRGDAVFERERRRSASPPPKKREPTPDLTGVVPILERKRRLTQWDIKPPGYENVAAEQAKLSGMFPLPGAPRQQAMDPAKLQAFVPPPPGSVPPGMSGGGGGVVGGPMMGGVPGGAPGAAGVAGPPVGSAHHTILKPSNSRQSKRLVAWNIPPAASEDDVLSFFNLQLNGLNVVESTDPCVMCQLSPDHRFAMLEFRTAADATVALALDGIEMEGHGDGESHANGDSPPTGFEIKRPKDYIVPAVADEAPYQPGVVSSVVVDTPNKISVSNIPPYLTDEQVTELLVSFGELKAFVLAKDRGTDESRGIAFCEYVDPAATDVAIQGLHGMELGDKRLKARKASVGITQVSGEMGVNAMSMLAGTISMDPDVSRVLQLLNMITPDELLDNDDYEEIREDVQEECSKFGTILGLKIPRPVGGARQQANGVGKIYIKYDTPESAKKALQSLAGRKFADRTVVTTYFPEENFDVGAW